jgi:NTP pyrophosphatase (non-canonical NTP hydrolase)
MTLDEYQAEALRTAASSLGTHDLTVRTLGLCGEAGEFADLVKKFVGHGHDLDHGAARKELGDVLWYVATLADSLGCSLDAIAQLNVAKLRARYPAGFSVDASKHRGD